MARACPSIPARLQAVRGRGAFLLGPHWASLPAPAIHASISDARNAVVIGPNFTGAGNVPALIHPQRVERPTGTLSKTWGMRSKESPAPRFRSLVSAVIDVASIARVWACSFKSDAIAGASVAYKTVDNLWLIRAPCIAGIKHRRDWLFCCSYSVAFHRLGTSGYAHVPCPFAFLQRVFCSCGMRRQQCFSRLYSRAVSRSPDGKRYQISETLSLNDCREFSGFALERNDIPAVFQSVQIVRPLLHHSRAFGQVLRLVIDALHAANGVGHLRLAHFARPAHFT